MSSSVRINLVGFFIFSTAFEVLKKGAVIVNARIKLEYLAGIDVSDIGMIL